jgi:hypothetical protein
LPGIRAQIGPEDSAPNHPDREAAEASSCWPSSAIAGLGVELIRPIAKLLDDLGDHCDLQQVAATLRLFSKETGIRHIRPTRGSKPSGNR